MKAACNDGGHAILCHSNPPCEGDASDDPCGTGERRWLPWVVPNGRCGTVVIRIGNCTRMMSLGQWRYLGEGTCRLIVWAGGSATAFLFLAMVQGAEGPRREVVSIGSCRCEIQYSGGWRRLDESVARFELTDMKRSERVRGTIVPRGRHLIQFGCDEPRQPYALWLRSILADLGIPSHAVRREMVLGAGAYPIRATEIAWAENELQSTYWIFPKQGRVFVVHLFGWADDSRRAGARKEVLGLVGRLSVLPR